MSEQQRAEDVAPDWLAECRGLAYMILDIKAQYLQAKECMGGDSEFLADRILNYARYVDGPLRDKVEAARNDGDADDG